MSARSINRSHFKRTQLAAAMAFALGAIAASPLTLAAPQSVSGEATPFLRNVSNTPDKTSTKSKLEALTIYVPAMKADDSPIAGAPQVHPMVVTYTDTTFVDPVTGEESDDVWAAVSRDDGATWKRMNISNAADKTIEIDGVTYYGDARKPSIRVDGNLILVSWTSKYCPSGDPSGIGDSDDLFLVKGPQGVVDYDATYDRPDLGVVPFSCVWVARGTIAPSTGAITWYAPEQITSGRRDALQDVPFSARNAGFGLVWQEDPEGLNPGQAKGPGEGLSGATVNKQTDIWYSHLTQSQFTAIDIAASPVDGKPKPLYPFSSPVRVTDNATCKVVAKDPVTGVPTDINGLPICTIQQATYCATTVEVPEVGEFCKTSYGVVLDGDTGASRPNLFMFPKTLPDGTVTAEAGLGYEETKGLGEGGGKPEDVYASGKLIRYHHFPLFTAPDIMKPGNILSLQAKDPATGLPLTWDDGTPKYENARRVRFILQAKTACGTPAVPTCPTIVAVYKQGIEGQGRPSDVMMRRALGGYEFGKFLPGAQNVSSPTVLSTTPTSSDDGDVKVTDWAWTEDNLTEESWANPFDDARAQRGAIRGNMLLFGYTWTPNWAAARNGNDNYNFFVRWSKDGGATWRTTPADPATFEEPYNISKLPNFKSTVIEPRTISTPGSITQPDGTFKSPDDKQNPNVFFMSYGTSTNVDTNLGDVDDDEEVEGATPEDLFYTWTEDAGKTYKTVLNKNTGLPENDKLAARDGVAEGEAQLRVVPSGTKLYAVWNHEWLGDPSVPINFQGSDAWFRKIVNLPDTYDLDGDGDVDSADIAIFRTSLGKCTGQPGFIAAADYDNDGCVTLVDYQKLLLADKAN
jgi:hypothetical protein